MKKVFLFLSVIFIISNYVLNAQWVQTNGPYGASVTSFVSSPNGNGRTNLFASTEHSGVFLSTDNGTNWTAVNSGLTQLAVNSLAVSSDNKGVINLFAGTIVGVFLSTNQGVSWTIVNNGLFYSKNVTSLVVSGTKIYLGTANGVYISTNNGSFWSVIGKKILNITSLAISPDGAGGSKLIIGTNGNGIFSYHDNDTGLVNISNGFPVSNTLTIQSLAVSTQESGVTNIFAGMNNNSVFRSTDYGASWFKSSNGLFNSEFINSLSTDGTNLFAGTNGNGIYLSTDNGSNWSQVNNGLTTTIVQSITISGTDIFAGTDRGIFHSGNNGLYWTYANNGLFGYDITSVIQMGQNFLAGTNEDGAFISSDNGVNWVNIDRNSLPVYYVDSYTNNGPFLFAGTNYGVYLSPDNGNYWTSVNNGMPTLNGYLYAHINALLNSPLGTNSNIFGQSNLFASIQGQGIYNSTDNGNSWTAVNNGLTNNEVWSLASTFSGSNIFAGTSNGVFLSSNNGTNWYPIGMATGNAIKTLAVSSAGIIYAGTLGGVYCSTNNGTTWKINSIGSSSINVYSITISDTSIFAGTDQGIFESTINFPNWKPVNNGLLNTTVFSLIISSDGLLYAGTKAGVYKRPISEMQLYSVTAQVDPPNSGTIKGSGNYFGGDQATISCVPVSGYIFKGWYTNGILISSKSSYTFSVTSTVTLVAKLEVLPFTPVATKATNINQFSFNANWKAANGATGYYLDVAIDGKFKNILSSIDKLDVGKNLSYLVNNLPIGSTFYYRVFSYNDGGMSLSPSDTIAVQTLPLAPTSPIALAPSDLKETSFTANWSPVTGATGYYLTVAVDEALTKLIFGYNKKDVGNVTSFQISGLLTNSNYYFGVSAYNPGGESAISNPMKVSIITGIDKLNSVPTAFELNQNFPNPFNPTTKINYGIPKAGFVKINIYNVLGTLVTSLVNENQAAGYYSIELNAGSLTSGIYFYRMESGSFSQTKKLLLLK